MYNELIISTIPGAPVRVDRTQRENKKAGALCEMHFHDEIELIYVDEGQIDVIIGEKRYCAEKGTTLYISSRTPHITYAASDGTSGTLVQFRTEDFLDNSVKSASKYLPGPAVLSDKPLTIFPADSPIAESMRGIMKEYNERKNAYETFIISAVYSILGFLYRNDIIVDAAAYIDAHSIQKLLPILEYINENYNKALTLDTVSSEFGLNPSYFSRMFKKAVGSGYTEYLNFVRVSRAEKLLRSTDMNVLDIALEVGFSSVSYFNRVFKKIKNCTPSVYKSASYSEM